MQKSNRGEKEPPWKYPVAETVEGERITTKIASCRSEIEGKTTIADLDSSGASSESWDDASKQDMGLGLFIPIPRPKQGLDGGAGFHTFF